MVFSERNVTALLPKMGPVFHKSFWYICLMYTQKDPREFSKVFSVLAKRFYLTQNLGNVDQKVAGNYSCFFVENLVIKLLFTHFMPLLSFYTPCKHRTSEIFTCGMKWIKLSSQLNICEKSTPLPFFSQNSDKKGIYAPV